MPTFKLTVAYDGTGFVGWQRQAAGESIQGLIEHACGELDGREVAVVAAGRTDAGVHALGQVVGVTLVRAIDARSVATALNARLPPAVRVVNASETADGFNARFQARSKSYRYRIWNADVLRPFERLYCWHVSAQLNVEAMHRAALLFEGRHDFAAMQAAGSDVQSTERTVFSSVISHEPPALVTYEISGEGFLRHMVRNIVGSLVEVGRGRQRVEWISEVLASKDRAAAGPTAPAEGLFLVRVEYD